MKVYIPIVLVLCIAQTTPAQSALEGKIMSVNGKTIPKVVVSAEKQYQTDIFTGTTEDISTDGKFRIAFDSPGIYNVSIHSVFHNDLSFPFLVYDQEPVSIDIYLIPKVYNDGRYFGIPEYREWIRVYGNFNGYKYEEGVDFELNRDGSVSAQIETHRDTLRYQTRGLADGQSVLPGASAYHLRPDGSFEGVLVKAEGADEFEIKYDPSEEFPYPRAVGDFQIPVNVSKRAFFHFKNPNDRYWTEPLVLRNGFYLPFSVIDAPLFSLRDSSLKESINEIRALHLILKNLEKRKNQVEAAIDKQDLHQQQKSALYIAYAGLAAVEKQYIEYTSRQDKHQKEKADINTSLIERIINEVSPLHPLWAGRHSPVILAEVLNCNTASIQYLEQVAENHTNNRVVRDAILFLTRFRAADFSEAEDTPYHNWVINRYGNGNLAGLVRQLFRESKNQEPGPSSCRSVQYN